MEPSSRTHPFPKSDGNGNLIHPEVAESAERAKAVAHGAIDRAADAAASAVDVAVSRGAQWRAAQQRLADDAVACMRANPLAAIGLAFGAGFLISRLLGGRD
ncbi:MULTISPECIES: hypothetical protein [Ralstonia solanacearum species complex]|uniref:DUF883 domain-containing protein n=1 Tax=Ralstonia solanacearum K60 TaxID=1091042 RepID=A0AAP7ZH57_RALSL|nr:hypothetical protein [Ralstonia solanacearum]AST35467.2 hypothetical protein CDC46_26020 [Ralstonia solanacearum]ATJ89208.1 hypothetical protein CDC59_23880 [Ralstonia solanacearum]AYB54424.1 hypothetical protein C2I38_24205 [Ralstonia solanacearum]AYB58983.1 hypothetical protein C2L97_24160 [Ralstonia solanacearum]MBT1539135.1 hypothetical protein [Ralstonia solanacearum]